MTCSLLQMIYILRRQWFEYIDESLDNHGDKCGFYRLWIVMVLLPTIYATPITILAKVKLLSFFYMHMYANFNL
jgi:hypothetical protein